MRCDASLKCHPTSHDGHWINNSKELQHRMLKIVRLMIILFFSLSLYIFSFGKAIASDPLPELPIIVSNYSSVITPNQLYSVTSKQAYFVFHLAPMDTIHKLRIVSRGLSNIGLAVVENEGGDIDKSCGPWLPSLEIKELSKKSKIVAVRLDSSHPIHSGIKLPGTLMFLAKGYRPMEVGITLDGGVRSDFRRGLTWAFGIAIPAFIAFVFALISQRIKSYFDDRDRFFTFRYQNYGDLKKLFTEHYQSYKNSSGNDDEEFIRLVYKKLVEDEIYGQIPPIQARKLLKNMEAKNRPEFEKNLVKIFPEWKNQIK